METNGRFKELIELQDRKANDLEAKLEEGFQSLTASMNIGFRSVTQELAKIREQGLIPAPLMHQLLETKEQTFRFAIKTMAWAFASVIFILSTLLGVRLIIPKWFV